MLPENAILVYDRQKNEDGTIKDSLYGWCVYWKDPDGTYTKTPKIVISRVRRWKDKSGSWRTDINMDPFRGKTVNKQSQEPLYNKQVQLDAIAVPDIVAAIVSLNKAHGIATMDGAVVSHAAPAMQTAQDKELDKAIDGMSEFDAF
jgi:hypothetical protein